jgi:hypothetical protein
MPIEVRELVIRATVDQNNERSGGRSSDRESNSGGQEVNECLTKMEEIKRMFQEKNER